MFNFLHVDRRALTLLMIVLLAFLAAATVPAEEARNLGQGLALVQGEKPFQDPDEDDPDPDPLVVEIFPLVLTENTTMLFRVDGAARVTLDNASGHRLFVAADGDEVVMTLAAGAYELRFEEWSDARGAVQLVLERVPNP